MGRVTANSRAGRSLIRTGKPYDPSNIPADIAEFNRKVDEKKAMKKLAKSLRSAKGVKMGVDEQSKLN